MLERAEYAMPSMREVRRLIRDHGWALLVVGGSGDLRAAHVPCLLDPVHDPGGAASQLVIIGHTARADPVVTALRSGHQVLVVFQGPNGYVSPAWYGEGPSPPTWNFSAVHVRGIPEVLQGGEAFSVLERTVELFEAARDDPWELRGDALADARRLAHETAPFRVRSAAIQAKAKLSQDKPPRIQDRVIAALEEGGPYRNTQLAAEMRRVLERRPRAHERPRHGSRSALPATPVVARAPRPRSVAAPGRRRPPAPGW
jgi:transcriptional regulator